MSSQRTKKILSWYHNEIEKDTYELENEKKKFIEKLKKNSKEKLFEGSSPKKYTLWQRIKKVLMGI